MKAALVIMAAGLGSRYGGNKQVDGVGPGGEILMEYSIHDAIRAGFTKIVFIIKDDMVDLMRTLCGDRIAGLTARDGEPVEVCYAVQDYSSLPAFYTVPAGRTKPFGTTHAVLCARPYVQEPFCVINADDYYGVDAYRAIYQELGRLPQQGKATMVGYLLRNTVSAHGTVSRGVCHVENGHLTGIHEALKIQLFPDGSIADVADGQRRELAADMPVSMNFWGFMPSIFDQMEEYLDDFLRALRRGDQGGVPAAQHGGRSAEKGTAVRVRAAFGGPVVRYDVSPGPAGRCPGAGKASRKRNISPHAAELKRRIFSCIPPKNRRPGGRQEENGAAGGGC